MTDEGKKAAAAEELGRAREELEAARGFVDRVKGELGKKSP